MNSRKYDPFMDMVDSGKLYEDERVYEQPITYHQKKAGAVGGWVAEKKVYQDLYSDKFYWQKEICKTKRDAMMWIVGRRNWD